MYMYVQDEQYSELDSFIFMKNHCQNMLEDTHVSGGKVVVALILNINVIVYNKSKRQ